LLPQRLLDRPLDHRLSRIDSDLLKGIEVEIKAGPILAESSTRHDFSPTLGQGTNLTLIRRLGALERHDEFLLELMQIEKMGNSS
jgi:hypothetical protein